MKLLINWNFKIDEDEKSFSSYINFFVLRELEDYKNEVYNNRGEDIFDINEIYNDTMDYLNIIIFKITELRKYKILNFTFKENISIGFDKDKYDKDMWFLFCIDKKSMIFKEKQNKEIFIKSLERNLQQILCDKCLMIDLEQDEENDLLFSVIFKTNEYDSDTHDE